MKVKNELNPTAKIAIVGEAPGEVEIAAGRPFVGPSGNLLFGLLARAGVQRSQCSVLNVVQDHPPNNDISKVDLTPWVEALKEDFSKISPNVVLLCGSTALAVALGRKESVDNWRGSVFWSPVLNKKCVSALHPARVLREYELMPLFNLDIRKAVRHAQSPEFVEWDRSKFVVNDTLPGYLARLKALKSVFAFDIEGSKSLITCIGFADSPDNAFTIPLVTPTGARAWSDEPTLLCALAQVLQDPNRLKVGHNVAYDIHALMGLGILVRGPISDTMLQARALMPEIPVGLDTQVSIWTDHCYYKSERNKFSSWEEFLRYNATDAAVTFELHQKLSQAMTDPGQKAYFEFTKDLLWPAIYMQSRGLRVDLHRRRGAIDQVTNEWLRLQRLLDVFKPVPDSADFFRRIVVRKGSIGWDKPKARFAKAVEEIKRLAENLPILSPEEYAHLRVLTGTHLNTSSSSEVSRLLFNALGISSADRSTDVGNLLTLMQRAKVTPIQRLALSLILRIRAVRKIIEMLSAEVADDGRWYFTINLAGTETGRPTASRTQFGINPLTAPKHGRLGALFRPIISAEPDSYIFEVDLSGADGWTVAAHCARLGDRTMLDDYLQGIKPYMVIAAMFLSKNPLPQDRTSLRAFLGSLNVPDWLKFAAKRVQHGTSYGLGPRTGVIQLLKDSWKIYGTPIFVPIETFSHLQNLFLIRYPGVQRWHNESRDLLKRTGKLRTPNGALRTFFGRRTDDSTFREWLAHEPQMNTAYATYLALHRLWYDRSNRQGGRLIVRPILMFYDALIGEFRRDDEDFAVRKLKEWFNNTITIAGVEVKISYEGGYGPAWGLVEKHL